MKCPNCKQRVADEDELRLDATGEVTKVAVCEDCYESLYHQWCSARRHVTEAS